ncbi:MAG: Holliday junction branch migration protein RuvA [Bacteroidaceae bacterium]|nr:Holliday junction branch migration protein RuvA [Bacteroidaceae bacterium]
MIEYLKGRIDELTPATVTIECAGVGYLINISLNTYSVLQGKEEAKIYVYEAIREDAWTLFGFANKNERSLFLMLIGISGIGGNTARTILSSFSAYEFCNIVEEGNDRLLSTVKGLGKKTAQKIILELKDKIASLGIIDSEPRNSSNSQQLTINKELYNEAVEALKMLGFPPAPTSKVVRSILTEEPDAPVEKVIKLALKML